MRDGAVRRAVVTSVAANGCLDVLIPDARFAVRIATRARSPGSLRRHGKCGRSRLGTVDTIYRCDTGAGNSSPGNSVQSSRRLA